MRTGVACPPRVLQLMQPSLQWRAEWLDLIIRIPLVGIDSRCMLHRYPTIQRQCITITTQFDKTFPIFVVRSSSGSCIILIQSHLELSTPTTNKRRQLRKYAKQPTSGVYQ